MCFIASWYTKNTNTAPVTNFAIQLTTKATSFRNFSIQLDASPVKQVRNIYALRPIKRDIGKRCSPRSDATERSV